MTARHILSRWERVAPMLTAKPLRGQGNGRISSHNAWMSMLQLADASQLDTKQLAARMDFSRMSANTILAWMVHNQLAVITNGTAGCHNAGNALIYAATPLLYATLGIKPTTEVAS